MSKFASFLAGMGGGYIKAKDKEYERERQAKEDAWREEQQGWQRADRAEKDALRTSMKDAFADRSTIDGTAVTSTSGTNLYKDPAQAQAAADDARIEAEMRGESPSAVATMQATGITGNMSKGHKITTEPVDLSSLNSRDAKMARGVNALMAAGNPMEAMSLQQTSNQMRDAQEARIKLLEKEGVGAAMAALRGNDPVGAMKAFQSSGSTKLPDGAKFVQAEGTDIFTGKPGKVWSVVGPDGAVLMPDVGVAAAKFLGIDGLIARDDKIRAEEAAAKDAGIRERLAAVKEEQLRFAMNGGVAGLRGAGSGSGSGRSGNGSGSSGQPAANSFDPLAGFDSKQAQTAATAYVDKKLEEGGMKVSAQERARLITEHTFALSEAHAGRSINRQRASVFLAEARKARTPQEIESVRLAALDRGFTPAEMAAFDPRFKKVDAAPPAPPPTPPGSKPTTPPASGSGVQNQSTQAPPPMATMEEIQRQTRANKTRILNRENLAEKDPDIQKLRIFAEQSLRDGKPVLANQAMSAIEQIKQKRYAAK